MTETEKETRNWPGGDYFIAACSRCKRPFEGPKKAQMCRICDAVHKATHPIKEHRTPYENGKRAGAAAERARIRAKVEELHDLAAENLMPMGDPYYEGARDYLDTLLQFFDAGEPKAKGEG